MVLNGNVNMMVYVKELFCPIGFSIGFPRLSLESGFKRKKKLLNTKKGHTQ